MKSTNPSEAVSLILKVGAVPSFSHSEDRLHPLIRELISEIPGSEIIPVANHNLVITIPGERGCPVIALTAHLDKNDHYHTGDQCLDSFVRGNKIVGPMDDSAGLGICIAIARASTVFRFPPLMLLFSEQEECGGAGAYRISEYILNQRQQPSEVITIDTSPIFLGKPGLAIYSEMSEPRGGGLTGSSPLKIRTDQVVSAFMNIAPTLVPSNNYNDYVVYRAALNLSRRNPVPSIALEPSIYPYHKKNEEVFIADILSLEAILQKFLSQKVSSHYGIT